MENLKISELDWGNDSAEKDPNLLKYFISSTAYERLKKLSKTFIIGRKGSGKSAIRKKLSNEIKKEFSDHFLVEIVLKFNTIKNIYNDNNISDNFNDEIFFQYIWLIYLFHKSTLEVANDPKLPEGEIKKYFLEYAKKENQGEKTILDSLKIFLNSLTIKAGKLGDLGIQLDETLRESSDIETFEYNFKKLLERGFKITWIIDDLDIGWNNSLVSNNFILGLLACLY